MGDTPEVTGWVDPRFEAVYPIFECGRRRHPDWSGAVAAYFQGELVVDLCVGPKYRERPVQVLYSAGKGIAAICLAFLVDAGELDYDAPVARYWPEFAANGKATVSVAELISHQAGLLAVCGGTTLDEYLAQRTLAERLAAEPPLWSPGTAHGYHALSWGTLVDELCRRVTGDAVAGLFGQILGERYALDLCFGLPESEEWRVVPTDNRAAFRQTGWSGMRRLATTMGGDFPPLAELESYRAVRAVGPPACGAIGSAYGLASAYAAALTGIEGLPALVSREALARAAAPRSAGTDLVLGEPSAFAAGFQTPSATKAFAGPGSFGHDGFAGALGLACPRVDLSFGLVTSHIPEPAGGADPLSWAIVDEIMRMADAILTRGRPSAAP